MVAELSRFAAWICSLALCANAQIAAQLLPGSDPASLGPLGGWSIGVAVHPADPDQLLVALIDSDEGLYRSYDGGVTLVADDPGSLQFNDHPAQLLVDPQDPMTVYYLTFEAIHRSTDFGTTWETLPFGSFGSSTFQFMALPTSGNDIMVATSNRIFRSGDGGANFEEVVVLNDLLTALH